MRIAIIGAGAAGLSAIKICLEENVEPTCFEMSNDIAGLWNYTNEVIKGRISVYKSTIANTSKELSSFSDFPMPSDYPNFIHHSKFLNYYRLYANEFKLMDKIKFKCKVLSVLPALDHETTGKWILRYSYENSVLEDVFDAVMVCTGVLWNPYVPIYKGLNDENKKFKGEVIHGSNYRDSKGFDGKNVLIVGLGNSGCDIGVELSSVAANVYMSVHHGLWCTSRVGKNGLPNDLSNNRLLLQIGRLFPNFMKNRRKKKLNEQFDHELYGLKPPENILVKRTTVNDHIASCILNGSIKIRPNIAEFFENKCLFEDNTFINDLDVVILATGYDVSVPFIFDESIVKFKNNFMHLYKSVFPPNLNNEHATLSFIGFVGNRGPLNPVFELQSRWALKIFKKLHKLPSLEVMENDIASKTKAVKTKFDKNRKLVLFEFGLKYTDELAEKVGCKPSLCELK